MTSSRAQRRADRALRPFWLHQAAEYLLGLVLVAQGLQSPTPTIPALAGGLVLANAAIVEGPLGAFRIVSRRMHRWCDVAVIAALVIAAVLPFLDVDNTTRSLMVMVAAILGVVWWNTRFERPGPRPGAPVARSEAVGRFAGRTVGGAVRAVRNRRGV